MTIYITQGRYTQQALKGLIDKPEDRATEVRKLFERSGGKMLAYYVTFGDYDFLTISEGSDPIATFAALATAGAGGGVSGLKTTVALTTAEAKQGFEMANKAAAQFRSAGT